MVPKWGMIKKKQSFNTMVLFLTLKSTLQPLQPLHPLDSLIYILLIINNIYIREGCKNGWSWLELVGVWLVGVKSDHSNEFN